MTTQQTPARPLRATGRSTFANATGRRWGTRHVQPIRADSTVPTDTTCFVRRRVHKPAVPVAA